VIFLALVKSKHLESINPLVFDSISLLVKNPFLFVPKLLIAFLYGIGAFVAVDLSKTMFSFRSLSQEQLLAFDFSSFLISVGLLFALTIFSFFLDLFFSGLYPLMISLVKKNKFSLKESLVLFKPKIVLVLISGIIFWVLITVISLIEAVVILFFNLSYFGLSLSLIIAFIFIFIFYFLYPKIVFEKSNLSNTFVDSFFISLKNKRMVFLLSLIPFSASVLKLILAYFSDSIYALIIFWVLVILTGIIYSAHAVINQLAYESAIVHKK
jgi:hypothetical protein